MNSLDLELSKKLNEIEQMLQDLDIDSRALNHNNYLHVSEPDVKDELIEDKAVLNGNQNGNFETVNFRNCWDIKDVKESRKQRPTGTATRYSTGRSFADKSTSKTVCQSTDGNRFLPCSPMYQVSSTPLCSDLSSHAHSLTEGILTTQPSTHSLSSSAVSWKEIENSSFSDDDLPVLVIDLKERLNRTYPIWFLPDISREGATHLLQGKDEGNFIVRKSSTQNTYALTVRLPEGCKHIEHYLVEILPGNMFKLEGSQNVFSHLLLLVFHYCQCCDELPVKLCLPQALAQATTCAELSSHAHLGQEFWVSLLVQGSVGIHATSVKKVESQENLSLTTFKPLTSPAEMHEGLKQGASVFPIKPPVPPKPVITAKISSVCSSQQAVHQKVPNVSESSSTTNCLPLTYFKSNSLLQTAKKFNNVESSVENMEVKREETLVSHYQQSDIVDNPIVYYRSSLDDKVSDYEDLEKFDMGNRSNVVSNDNKCSFAKSLDPEKKGQKDTACLLTFNKQNIALESLRKDVVSSSTQTYEAKEEIPQPSFQHMQPIEKVVRSNSFKIQNTCTWKNNETTSMDYQGISSPFYALPVDAVDVVNSGHFSSSLIPSLNSTVFTQLPDELKTQNCLQDDFTTDENSLSVSREKVHSSPLVSSQSYNSKIENPIQFSNEQKKPKDCAVEKKNIHVSLQCTNEKLNIPVKPRCSFKKRANHQEWASDTSWEWCDHDDEEEKELQDTESECEISEPMFRNYKHGKHAEYENLKRNKGLEDNQPADNIDDTSTVFSEPWDQRMCYRFLHSAPETFIGKEDIIEKESSEQIMKNNQLKNVKIETLTSSDESHHSSVNSETDSSTDDQVWNYPTIPADGHVTGNDNVHTIAGHITTALQNIHTPQGEVIRNYIFRLANDKSTLFAKQIVSFIECTRESRQVNPVDNLRLIRQFMSGLSNFLVKNGEGKFSELIKQEQGKLQANKFLNIDLIIEETLHELVIKPLKEYVYQLFKDEYTRDGSLQLLTEGIKYAKTKTPQEIGIRDGLQPPDAAGLDIVKTYFKHMENEHSPLRKLENLLGAMSSICNSVHGNRKSQGKDHASLGADDFLPIFIYVLAQCELVSAETEANYMWGLLHSSWHSGEGGYYLTTLSSAVHAIKQLQLESKKIMKKPAISFFSPIKQPEEKTRLPSVGDLQSCMKILFPEESSGDIRYKTLPIKPNMTTREVCRMAASKFCVTNPQDYGLFKLVGEVETKLEGSECPQTMKAEGVVSGQESLFIYRRCDGKFVWPCWSKF